MAYIDNIFMYVGVVLRANILTLSRLTAPVLLLITACTGAPLDTPKVDTAATDRAQYAASQTTGGDLTGIFANNFAKKPA